MDSLTSEYGETVMRIIGKQSDQGFYQFRDDLIADMRTRFNSDMDTSARLLSCIALCKWLLDVMANQKRDSAGVAETHVQLLAIAIDRLEELVRARYEELRDKRETAADAWNDANIEVHEAATEAMDQAIKGFNAYLYHLNAYYREQAEAAARGETWNMDPQPGPVPDGDDVMSEAAASAVYEHGTGFSGATIRDAFVPSAPVILQKPRRKTGMMYR